jgi:hypothetical protein
LIGQIIIAITDSGKPSRISETWVKVPPSERHKRHLSIVGIDFSEENRDFLGDNNRLRGEKTERTEETGEEDWNSGRPLAMVVELSERISKGSYKK